jgi:predicted component of type VI protein secretion system
MKNIILNNIAKALLNIILKKIEELLNTDINNDGKIG